MLIPVLAGILSALRRVIARRVSLKVFTHFPFKHLSKCTINSWNSSCYCTCIREYVKEGNLISFFFFRFLCPSFYSMIPEPTEKEATCHNYCFCYLFSLPSCHVGRDHCEWLFCYSYCGIDLWLDTLSHDLLSVPFPLFLFNVIWPEPIPNLRYLMLYLLACDVFRGQPVLSCHSLHGPFQALFFLELSLSFMWTV